MEKTKAQVIKLSAELRAKLSKYRDIRRAIAQPTVLKRPYKIERLNAGQQSTADGTELNGNCNWL